MLQWLHHWRMDKIYRFSFWLIFHPYIYIYISIDPLWKGHSASCWLVALYPGCERFLISWSNCGYFAWWDGEILLLLLFVYFFSYILVVKAFWLVDPTMALWGLVILIIHLFFRDGEIFIFLLLFIYFSITSVTK